MSEHETPSGTAPEAAGEAIGHDGTDEPTWTCKGCERIVTADETRCPACGRFGPGHTFSLVHGRRSHRVPAGALEQQQAFTEALQAATAQIVADLGGVENLSRLKADAVEDYQRLTQVAEFLWAQIVEGGVLTKTKKAKQVYEHWRQVVAQRQALRKELGLERRARRARSFAERIGGEA